MAAIPIAELHGAMREAGLKPIPVTLKGVCTNNRKVSEVTTMTTRAYCRCNGGHYFIGEFCPFDGWSSQASRELTEASERLGEAHQEISVESLRKAGVNDSTIQRTILITFGADESVFDAFAAQ
jgi:hypothetical protein